MANIRSLPSGNWNAQVRVKGKSPQSKTFSTKAEAELWANQLEAVTMDRKHHTIYTLGMTYCETMLKGKGSYDHALMIVEHLGKHFTQPIHEITPQRINDFKIVRLKTGKPSKCRTQLAFMSRFCRFAKRGLLIMRTHSFTHKNQDQWQKRFCDDPIFYWLRKGRRSGGDTPTGRWDRR